MSDMPDEIWAGDITEGSNNALCQIEKRHDHFHTEYTRTDMTIEALLERVPDDGRLFELHKHINGKDWVCHIHGITGTAETPAAAIKAALEQMESE